MAALCPIWNVRNAAFCIGSKERCSTADVERVWGNEA